MRKFIILAVVGLAAIGCANDDADCKCNAKYINLSNAETHLEPRSCDKLTPVGQYDVFVECVEPSY